MTRSNGEPRFKCHGKEACKDTSDSVSLTDATYCVSAAFIAGIMWGLIISRFYI